MTLGWQAAAGARAYMLEIGTASGASDLLNDNIGNRQSISGVAPKGTFFARVRSRNLCGVSAPSNEAMFTV